MIFFICNRSSEIKPSNTQTVACRQRPHSFWSTSPRIPTSGWAWFSEHEQSFHFVFSTIWQSELSDFTDKKVCESPTSSVGPSQRLWFLVLTKRSTASRNANVACQECVWLSLPWSLKDSFRKKRKAYLLLHKDTRCNHSWDTNQFSLQISCFWRLYTCFVLFSENVVVCRHISLLKKGNITFPKTSFSHIRMLAFCWCHNTKQTCTKITDTFFRGTCYFSHKVTEVMMHMFFSKYYSNHSYHR